MALDYKSEPIAPADLTIEKDMDGGEPFSFDCVT